MLLTTGTYGHRRTDCQGILDVALPGEAGILPNLPEIQVQGVVLCLSVRLTGGRETNHGDLGDGTDRGDVGRDIDTDAFTWNDADLYFLCVERVRKRETNWPNPLF